MCYVSNSGVVITEIQGALEVSYPNIKSSFKFLSLKLNKLCNYPRDTRLHSDTNTVTMYVLFYEYLVFSAV